MNANEDFMETESHVGGAQMQGHQCQELTLGDKISFLHPVIMSKFGKQPQAHNDSLDIEEEFKSLSIDTAIVNQRIPSVFGSLPELGDLQLELGSSCEVQPNEQVQVSIPDTNLGGGATSSATSLTIHPGGSPTTAMHLTGSSQSNHSSRSTSSYSSPVNAVRKHPIYTLQNTLDCYYGSTRPLDDGEWDQPVWSVKFSPSGESLASGGAGKIMVWNAAGELEKELVCEEGFGVAAVDWSKDGSHLVSASALLKLWDVKTGECVKIFREHKLKLLSAKFSRDGGLISSGSHDGTAKIYNAETGECLETFVISEAPVTAVDFHPDRTRFMSTSYDGCCHVYDLNSRKVVEDFTNANAILAAKFSPDSRYILFSKQDCSLSLYDMRMQKVVGTYTARHLNAPLGPNFTITTSGKYIVSGSFDSCIYIWDLKTQGLVQKLEGHTDEVECVDCHPQYDIIASGALDDSIKIWKSY